MQQGIIRQVRIAVEQADLVVCVLDGTEPPTEADREAVELLRRSEKPVIYVANKVDTDARRPDAQRTLRARDPGAHLGLRAARPRHRRARRCRRRATSARSRRTRRRTTTPRASA